MCRKKRFGIGEREMCIQVNSIKTYFQRRDPKLRIKLLLTLITGQLRHSRDEKFVTVVGLREDVKQAYLLIYLLNSTYVLTNLLI